MMQPPAAASSASASSAAVVVSSSGPQMTGRQSFNGSATDDEVSRSALSTFKAKEEIERRKMEVWERVQAQLGRVEEESKRLAMIREELEALGDPTGKEVAQVRKKIGTVNKELKPLGVTVQKKVYWLLKNCYGFIFSLEKEYKDALDAFNEKNKEKAQLIIKLVEVHSIS